MSLKYLLVFILLSTQISASPLTESTRFDSLLTHAELTYTQGDSFFSSEQIDSVLTYYIRARRIVNELFFQLLETKKNDTLNAADVTAQWDKVITKMQVKLDSVPDCEFDRCMIYREEKVANWCIAILDSATTEKRIETIQKFQTILENDAKSQFRDIFDKLYNYIRLQFSLERFQLALNPQNEHERNLWQVYLKFLKYYQDYRDNLVKE